MRAVSETEKWGADTALIIFTVISEMIIIKTIENKDAPEYRFYKKQGFCMAESTAAFAKNL